MEHNHTHTHTGEGRAAAFPSHHIHRPLPQRESRPSRTLHSLTSSFTCRLARCWICGRSACSRHSAANLGTALAFAGVAQRTRRTVSTRTPRSASVRARGCGQESVFRASAVKCVALGIATTGMHGLAVIWFERRPRVPVMLSRFAGAHGLDHGWENPGRHAHLAQQHPQLNNNGRSMVSVDRAGLCPL